MAFWLPPYQVRQLLAPLLQLWPGPEEMSAADPNEVQEVIRPLGLFRKRALSAIRFSEEYLHNQVGVHPAGQE